MFKNFVATAAAFLLTTNLFGCSVENDKDSQTETNRSPIPVKRKYELIIRADVPPEKAESISMASKEWSTASQGAIVFQEKFMDFDVNRSPDAYQIRVYTAPKSEQDKSDSIGVAGIYPEVGSKMPIKTMIWIESNLSARIHYLVALHEIGHAVGMNHIDSSRGPTTMNPSVQDFGGHPSCLDRKELCSIWGCDPGSECEFVKPTFFTFSPEIQIPIDQIEE